MTQSSKNTNSNLANLLEIVLHIGLLVIVPVIFLEVTTGFDKYLLPDFINYVYSYWLLYLIVVPLIYSRIGK